ncbi:MAG: alpha/beta fold hydrolase [Longimicrobiales bacterium]
MKTLRSYSPRRAVQLTIAGSLALGVALRPDDASAQQPPVGTWTGVLEGVALQMIFHFAEASSGGFEGTMDVPAQGASGVPLGSVVFESGGLSFLIPSAPGGAGYEGIWSDDEQMFRGTFSQSGQSFTLNLSLRDSEDTGPARPQTPEGPFPYEAVDVRFSNTTAGIELAGTLSVPAGDGPYPAVVTITGSGPQDRDETILGHRPFAVIADHLTRQGIAVLRFDDRGVGESGGDFASATSLDFADDAQAAVGFLRSRPEIDPRRIGLIGHSEGGLIAPIIASRSADVAFLVLLAAPGVSGENVLYEQSRLIGKAAGLPETDTERNAVLQRELFRIVLDERNADIAAPKLRAALERSLDEMTDAQLAQAGVTPETRERFIAGQVAFVNSAWMRVFLTHDPAEPLSKVTVPVLALSGSLDLQVSAEQNLAVIERSLGAAGNQDYTIRELDGLNHLFQPATTGAPGEYARIEVTIDPSVLDLVTEWILARFGG